MMTQAFYTGISGLQSTQTAIDITADNLANVNTVGYRGYSGEFASLFEKSLNTSNSSSDTVGIGSRIQSTTMDMSRGTQILSEKSTDLSIAGNGWFGIGRGDDISYTRDGNFSFDANSNLVNIDGDYVLGTMSSNIDGNILNSFTEFTPLGSVSSQEQLKFPTTLVYPAEPTTKASFMANVGVDALPVGVSASVVDGEGFRNSLRLTFTKTPTQPTLGSTWDIVAQTMTANGEVIYDTVNGSAIFDERGALVSHTLTTIDNNGAAIEMDLGERYSGVVSLSSSGGVSSSSSADGVPYGELSGYEVNQSADVIATFTNGMQSSVGKIALYHFRNEQGLDRVGGTKFKESVNSGDAIFYKDSDGNNINGATVVNYRLENSNVRLDVGLTDLIIYQRSFDANSKSITTADQMIQKALSMDA